MDMQTDRIAALLGHKRFHFFEGDITINREWIEYHVRKCDTVLPLVAIATPATYVKEPLKVFELDFEANLPIVRGCVKHGKRLVFPSTSEVYGMCADREFDPEASSLVYGPIDKQRWIYACAKQLMDRVIHAVGVNHAVHQLLRAGVDPALLVDRAVDERGRLRIELAVSAHAVDLRSRREDQALAVLHAPPHDRQIRLEIELEHLERLLDVGRRRRDRDQRQHRVTLAHVVLDPFAVDGDVALEEMEALVTEQRSDAVGLHVHAVDLPVRALDDALGKMMADKAVHAEDEDSFHWHSLEPRELAVTDALGEFLRGERLAVQFDLEELQHPPVRAGDAQAAAFGVEKRRDPSAGFLRTPRPQDAQPFPFHLGERAGVGWGDRADQIVHPFRRGAPVDTPVFRSAPAELAAFGK